ncbi:degenerin del-1-like isoform X1 [Rhipicephalus microplus]|uniref:degenerin del-1-like isoform X1 n=1 Tax=Rhipicephalus microplus TaxID=6941 RepID=UPI003F6C5805
MAQDLSAVVTDYLRFDDIVTVSVHEPARPTFPAVTVCNMNPMRLSALCTPRLPPVHEHDEALQYWRRLLCNSTAHRDIALSTEDLEQQRELTDWIKTVFRDNQFADLHLGHQMNAMVRQCTLNGEDCHKDNLLGMKSVHPYGECVCVGCNRKRGTHYVRDMNDGCRHGLSLVLDVELNEYVPLTVEAGFAIMVHYPWREIDVAKDVTFVAPGFSTYISVDRAEFKRLGHPYQNPCRSQWPPEISEYVDSEKHYTAHECRDYCYQVQIFEACGCVSPQYMRPGRGPINDAPTCPLEGTAGPVTCAKTTEMKIGRGGGSCECSQPCLDIAYYTSTSTTALHTRKGMNTSSGDKSFPGGHQAVVNVYRQSPQTRVRARAPKVQFATVLSRAGGLLGMYLGVSILLLLNLADALATALVQWISTKHWRQRFSHLRHEFLTRPSRENKPPLSLIL